MWKRAIKTIIIKINENAIKINKVQEESVWDHYVPSLYFSLIFFYFEN